MLKEAALWKQVEELDYQERKIVLEQVADLIGTIRLARPFSAPQ
jgi:hypothetical protein